MNFNWFTSLGITIELGDGWIDRMDGCGSVVLHKLPASRSWTALPVAAVRRKSVQLNGSY